MKLSDLKLHTKAIIKSIKNDELLKSRLHSFGVFEDSEISVQNIFISKQTIQIQNEDDTMIALRLSEANNIFVEVTA